MLSVIFNYLFIFFAIFLTIKSNDYYFNFNKLLFILSLFFHLFLTTIYINFFPTGDWETIIFNDHFRGNGSSATFFSTHLVMNIIFILKKFFFLKNINIIMSFSLISFFGVILFVKNLVKLGMEKKIACFLLFIPSVHFWTGVPGKDSLILFSLSCFFNLYIDRKIFLSLLFIAIVFLLRPHIGFIFILSIMITEFFVINSIKKKIFIFLFMVVGVFILLYFDRTSSFFINSDNLPSENIFLKLFNQLHSMTNKYSSSASYYGHQDFITNSFNYIFFPLEFIFKKKPLFINLSVIIEIISVIFIIYLILNSKTTVVVEKKIILFLSVCILIYLLIMPQSFFNFGLNSRQKWIILPFIIYFSFLLKNLFVRINKI